MPSAKRPQCQPTDAWAQLRLLVTSLVPELYELLRPIVLFGRTPAARRRDRLPRADRAPPGRPTFAHRPARPVGRDPPGHRRPHGRLLPGAP